MSLSLVTHTDPTPATQPVAAPAPQARNAQAKVAWPETRLLRELEGGRQLNGGEWAALERDIESEPNLERLWLLLRCSAHAPRIPGRLERRFAALKRLAQAGCVFLRAHAYQALAELHRYDLRFEMRAKAVLSQALKREQGIARKRLQHLMRGC